MSFQSSLKPIIGTTLVALYLPVPFYLLACHVFTGQWRKIGMRSFLILLPLYAVMVFAVIRAHAFWRLAEWHWPAAVSWLAVLPLGLAAGLVAATYKSIDPQVLHLVRQFVPTEERRLVTDGVLGWIRHPRYVMFTLIAFGSVIATGYPMVVLAAIVSTAAFAGVIRLEERELLVYFGEDYRRYRENVPAFIPRFKH